MRGDKKPSIRPDIEVIKAKITIVQCGPDTPLSRQRGALRVKIKLGKLSHIAWKWIRSVGLRGFM